MLFQVARAGDSDSAPLPLSTVEGRLTLTSGTPVTMSDVVGAGTLYFTPYKGDGMYLYDGTRWRLYRFSELSTDLSTAIPGGIVSGKNYDVFVQDNSLGSPVLSLSSPWTNDTTRADALTLVNGVYVASGNTLARYVGTIRASANNQTTDSATQRFLWNEYNRAPRKLFLAVADASHTYGTASWRPWNNSPANRVEVVIGQAEELVDLFARALSTVQAANEYGVVGIDVDGTASNDADMVDVGISATAGDYRVIFSSLKHLPAAGYHSYQMTEYARTATNLTFYGTYSDATLRRSGILGSVES